MSANTGDTEVETLETPTPPQNGKDARGAPSNSFSTPDRHAREDAIEEDSDEDNSNVHRIHPANAPSESGTEYRLLTHFFFV